MCAFVISAASLAGIFPLAGFWSKDEILAGTGGVNSGVGSYQIVLVALINQYRERGMSARDAIEHGAARRLRPILMTAAATIFALLPLGIGITGNGGFISQPLAIIVIGGLVSSTILTLIVLPTLYYLVEGRKERRDAKRAAKAAA